MQHWLPGSYVPPQPPTCFLGFQTEATSPSRLPLLRDGDRTPPCACSPHTPPLPMEDLPFADTYLFAMNGACVSWARLLEEARKVTSWAEPTDR